MAVGILALGIASVTAMWTVVNQVVLRPLPVREQDRLVVAWSVEKIRDVAHFPWTGEMFEAAERGGVPAFSGVSAVGSWGTSEVVVEDPEGPKTLFIPVTAAATFISIAATAGSRRIFGRSIWPRSPDPGSESSQAVR